MRFDLSVTSAAAASMVGSLTPTSTDTSIDVSSRVPSPSLDGTPVGILPPSSRGSASTFSENALSTRGSVNSSDSGTTEPIVVQRSSIVLPLADLIDDVRTNTTRLRKQLDPPQQSAFNGIRGLKAWMHTSFDELELQANNLKNGNYTSNTGRLSEQNQGYANELAESMVSVQRAIKNGGKSFHNGEIRAVLGPLRKAESKAKQLHNGFYEISAASPGSRTPSTGAIVAGSVAVIGAAGMLT